MRKHLPLLAICLGYSMVILDATIVNVALPSIGSAERAGIASGVLNASRQAGGAIGVALLGTLIAGSAFVSGLQAAMAVSAGSFLLGAVVIALAVERDRERSRPRA